MIAVTLKLIQSKLSFICKTHPGNGPTAWWKFPLSRSALQVQLTLTGITTGHGWQLNIQCPPQQAGASAMGQPDTIRIKSMKLRIIFQFSPSLHFPHLLQTGTTTFPCSNLFHYILEVLTGEVFTQEASGSDGCCTVL